MRRLRALGLVISSPHSRRVWSAQRGVLAFPLCPLFCSTRLYCSEAYINGAMVLLLLLLSLSMLFRDDGPRRSSLILAGCVGGLAALARLDNIFVIGMIFLGILLVSVPRGNGIPTMIRGFVATGLSLGLPFLCVVTPYLLHNQLSFGHVAPVSGAIKSTLPDLTFSIGGVSKLGQVCFLAALVGPFLCCFRRCDAHKRFVLLALSAGFILHTLQVTLMTSHHTGWPWYYVSGVINLAMLLCVVTDQILSRLPRCFARLTAPAPILISALALSIGVTSYAVARYRTPAPPIELGSFIERLPQPPAGRWQEALGLWLSDNLPPESRIIIYDWPGIIAYTSERGVLAPDGLINDYQYNDDLLKEGTSGYLKARQITYWLGPTSPGIASDQDWYNIEFLDDDTQRIEIFAPLYDESAGTFRIVSTNRVANLRDSVAHPDMPDLSRWRID